MSDADTLLSALNPETPPAAAPPATPPVETPPAAPAAKPAEAEPNDKVSKSLLALQRRESEIRRREREIEAREGAVKLSAERVDAAASILRDAQNGKIDAAEAIDRIAKATGVQLTTRQLVEAVAKKGRVAPAAPGVDPAALDEVKKSVAELGAKLTERERQDVRAVHESRIGEAMKDGDRYEAVVAAGLTTADVYDAMEGHFRATGEMLDIADALDRLETRELERAKRTRGLKKLTGGAPAGNGQETRATPAELTSGDGAAAQKPPATISQQLSGPGTRPVEAPEPKWNDHDAWLKKAGFGRD